MNVEDDFDGITHEHLDLVELHFAAKVGEDFSAVGEAYSVFQEAVLLDKRDPSKVLASHASRWFGLNHPSAKGTSPMSSTHAAPCAITTRSSCHTRSLTPIPISQPSRLLR